MPAADMQVLEQRAQTQDQVAKPYLQPLLPLCYLTAASGAAHAGSTPGAGSWEAMTQAPYPDQVPVPRMCLGKSRGKRGSCSAQTEEAGRATTAKGSL